MKDFVVPAVFAAWLIVLTLWHPVPSVTIDAATRDRAESEWSAAPIAPIGGVGALDSRVVALGQKLFNEKRLSSDKTVSCATCHELDTGGADRASRSTGVYGRVGARNAPSILNASLNFAQFWDGRAKTLEDQVDGPLHGDAEMGSGWPAVIAFLGTQADYTAAFRECFPDGVTERNAKVAIATYERSLRKASSRFDRYLHGEANSISAEEESGYHLFVSYGCASCHQGAGVGGNMFQKFGLISDTHEQTGAARDDTGRFAITGDERDKYVFKVPSLRNVALTPPYFHDGSAPTLESAIGVMGRVQLGRELSTDEIALIAGFLKTLNGDDEVRKP